MYRVQFDDGQGARSGKISRVEHARAIPLSVVVPTAVAPGDSSATVTAAAATPQPAAAPQTAEEAAAVQAAAEKAAADAAATAKEVAEKGRGRKGGKEAKKRKRSRTEGMGRHAWRFQRLSSPEGVFFSSPPAVRLCLCVICRRRSYVFSSWLT